MRCTFPDSNWLVPGFQKSLLSVEKKHDQLESHPRNSLVKILKIVYLGFTFTTGDQKLPSFLLYKEIYWFPRRAKIKTCKGRSNLYQPAQ